MGGMRELILEKVLPPAVSGIIGVATTIWRTTKGLLDKVKDMEAALTKLRADLSASQDLQDVTIEEKNQEILHTIEKLRTAIDDSAKIKTKEIVELRKLLSRITERISSVEQQSETLVATVKSLDQEMNNFIREQNEQWQATSRTLGQIEGSLRIASRRPSGSFPSQGGT